MEQEGLLQAEDIRPLSDRMRPESLEEYVDKTIGCQRKSIMENDRK